MDKDEVVKVLAKYSPPLSQSQIDEAAEKIVETAAKATESLPKQEPNRKPRR
jgi:hypothetical protein